jgi:hypothetical protein
MVGVSYENVDLDKSKHTRDLELNDDSMSQMAPTSAEWRSLWHSQKPYLLKIPQ